MLVDRDDVQVIALKPAFQGDAVVVRLASFAPAAVEVRLSCPSRPIRKATLCDACERALRDLEVRGDSVMVPMPYALASVLVWPDQEPGRRYFSSSENGGADERMANYPHGLAYARALGLLACFES
jgi:hypothetical protein